MTNPTAGRLPDARSAPAAGSLRLAELAQRSLERWEATEPPLRTARGLNATGLPDFSLQRVDADGRFARDMLVALDGLDEGTLSDAERLTCGTLRWAWRMRRSACEHWALQFPMSPYALVFSGLHDAFTSFRFDTAADAEAYLALLDSYPARIDGLRERAQAQAAAGVRLPQATAARVRALFAGFIGETRQSVWWATSERTAVLGAAERGRFERRMEAAIDAAHRALGALAQTFGDDYQAAAPSSYGLAQYPGGEAWYLHQIEEQLGFALTPSQVLAKARELLDEARAELAVLCSELGGGTPREVLARLAQEPAFRVGGPDELAAFLRGCLSRLDDELPRWFGRLPVTPCDVQRMPPAYEPSLAYGYFEPARSHRRLGLYRFNGGRLDERNLATQQVLVYHELVPGHHLQTALNLENDALDGVRRAYWTSANVEAWAEYAANLCAEMGAFRTPAERFGRRAFNLLFPARAIADVGLNFEGRGTEWACRFLEDHTVESPTQIASSVARDGLEMAAQILPYSLGAQRLRDWRREAQLALGARFDVRRWHDAVLAPGSVPPVVQQAHLAAFVAAEAAGA